VVHEKRIGVLRFDEPEEAITSKLEGFCAGGRQFQGSCWV